jgi:hypothetical protein
MAYEEHHDGPAITAARNIQVFFLRNEKAFDLRTFCMEEPFLDNCGVTAAVFRRREQYLT